MGQYPKEREEDSICSCMREEESKRVIMFKGEGSRRCSGCWSNIVTNLTRTLQSSCFMGVKFFTPFLKMVLPVAPLSLFRWFFDILNFSIHNVSTLFFKCLFFIYFLIFLIFFYSTVFLIVFHASFNLNFFFTIYFFEVTIFNIILSP